MFAVRLTPSGLRVVREGAETVIRPSSLADLLRYWHWELDGLDPDVTLGDVIRLLAAIPDIESLSGLFACDIAGFLAEAMRPTDTPVDSQIEYLEVYTVAELTWTDAGDRVPPYRVWRGFHGWGEWEEPYPGCWAEESNGVPMRGGYALDFSPVNELMPYVLRYNGTVQFTDEEFKPTTVFLATSLTITLGEFLHAIFWEIGFHGSVEERDGQRAVIEERLAEIRQHEAAEDAGGTALDALPDAACDVVTEPPPDAGGAEDAAPGAA